MEGCLCCTKLKQDENLVDLLSAQVSNSCRCKDKNQEMRKAMEFFFKEENSHEVHIEEQVLTMSFIKKSQVL